MKLDLTKMTFDEVKELNTACVEAIEDYEEKVNDFKEALTILVEKYPYRDCVNGGNTNWCWQELLGKLIV